MNEEREWTVMFYLASDNPLAPGTITHLKAIKNAGYHPEVNMLAQFDPHTINLPVHVFDVNCIEKNEEPEWFLLYGLKVDLLGHRVKVQRRITLVVFDQPIDFRSYYIDRLISQIFRVTTTATGKDSNQLISNSLVFCACGVAVRIEPEQ